MQMSRLEKRLVNRDKKGNRNIATLQKGLREIDLKYLHDVLELGCGMGTVSAFLATHEGLNVQGTDIDPKQVLLAQRQYPENDRLHFSVQDATCLAFNEASFDLILAQNTWHHVPNWPDAVSEAVRVLRPGGYLLWVDLVWPNVLRGLLRPLSGRIGLYTLAELETVFAASGLTCRLHKRLGHAPLAHHYLVWQKMVQTGSPLTLHPEFSREAAAEKHGLASSA